MPVQRLSHIGICVSDLQRSLVFYRDLLGFREVSKLDVSGQDAATLLGLEKVELTAIYLERDGTRIELLLFDQPGHETNHAPRPMNRLGLTHLSLRVEDLGAILTSLADAGAAVLHETRVDHPQFQVGAIFVTDPDGTRIELVQAPGDPNLLPGETPGSASD